MILSAHILAGAAIGVRFQNPILGIFLAFLSHYLLDMPPHREYSIDTIKERRWKDSYLDFLKIFLDASSAFAIIFFLVGDNPMAYLGAFAALIPDGFTLLMHIIFPQNPLLAKHFNFHIKFNEIGAKLKVHAVWEVLSQVTVAALAIYFLR